MGFGNTLPLLLPQVPNHEARPYRDFAPLLLANLNALIFEYVARQKVQGQHLNFYIVEQLPFVPPEAFSDVSAPGLPRRSSAKTCCV